MRAVNDMLSMLYAAKLLIVKLSEEFAHF